MERREETCTDADRVEVAAAGDGDRAKAGDDAAATDLGSAVASASDDALTRERAEAPR